MEDTKETKSVLETSTAVEQRKLSTQTTAPRLDKLASAHELKLTNDKQIES